MWRWRVLAFVTILAASAAPAWSRPALDDLGVELDFRGPVRLYHGARLHIDTIRIEEAGDQWSAGDVRFRFRLDVGPCPGVAAEMGDGDVFRRDAGVTEGFGLDDCPYQYEDTPGEMNVHDGDILNLNRWLPEPTELVATSQARVFRYGGDLVRTRIGGTELDLASDEFMGGMIGAVRCGFPASEGVCTTRPIDLDTCFSTPSGNTESWPCYQLSGALVIEPIRHSPDAHLDVTRVLASSGRCLEDRDLTIGAHFVNPERTATGAFRLRVARLDPDTGTIVDTWDSAPRAGLDPDEATTDPVAVTLRLGGGRHQLAIAAMEAAQREGPLSLARGGYMGTAAELEIDCLPDFTDLPVVVERTATSTTGPREIRIPGELVQPTATATRERVELPVARPTATVTPRELPTRRGP